MSLEKGLLRGVMKQYGVRTTDMKYGARIDDDLIKTAVWEFDYNDLPTYGTTNLEHVIPAGSSIIDCRFRIITAFASTSTTTDIDIGLYTSAGVAIDADGLVTVAEATQATIAVAGAVITGAGALIGKLTHASSDGELVVTPNVNDLTAGRGQVILRYVTAVAAA
jgi:hypothetical protein